MKERKNCPQTCETDYTEKHVTDSGNTICSAQLARQRNIRDFETTSNKPLRPTPQGGATERRRSAILLAKENK